MSFSIQTNVNSLVAQQNLNVINAFQSKTIDQLTSGYRINSSGDDAAGLAVANMFRNNVAEVSQGVNNANDAVSQLQIMDGGISNISTMLDRLQTLATQSASGTFTGDRTVLNNEFQSVVGEIDRQAQAIGLNTGGTFAKSLDVYIGGGSGSTSQAALQDGIVNLDLTKSTVDSASLGLTGMKAIAGTVAANGTDIGTGSSNGTTVQDIVSSSAGNAEAKSGYATFVLAGPGFSDDSQVSVAASLTGVSDVNTLVTAINTAIANAAGGSTQADQALKSAGIVATVNTDQYGHQQLAFSSSTTAFQVTAGDQMANALMGNFASAGSPTGVAVTSTVTGATTDLATNPFTPAGVSVQVQGAGLAGPVNFTFSSADSSVSDATSDLIKQVNQNAQLQQAGITASLTSDNKLQFTSATGATFTVSSSGDTANALGLGTFVTALNGAASYSDITAGTAYSQAATGNGVATLGFSLDGGATGGITPASITGAATGTGYNGGGTPNGTVDNAAGALGTMTLTLNGNSTVTVNFGLDANQSGTETAQQAADFINNQIQTQAGYGSDVKLATVDSATNTIVLTGPPDGAGTISASGTAASALGLTAVSGATIVAASGSAGNTVSVNLAGDDATGAVATGTAAAAANIATGTNTMELNIDGTAVNANFANDVNAAGTAAAFTSATLGSNGAASTVGLSSLQGTAASIAGGGITGVTSPSPSGTVNLSGYAAVKAASTGTAIAGATSATAGSVDLSGFAATSASTTSAALGTGGTADPTLSTLLSGYAAKAATVTGGALGTSANTAVGAGYALDVTQFAAAAASATGTTQLASTGLNLGAFAAQAAVMTGTAVAANDTATISALGNLNPADTSDNLIITVNDGTNTYTHAVNISGATNLDGVVSAINNDTTLNAGGTHHVVASDANGVLTLTSGGDLAGGATGAAKTITVAANNASLAVGLSTSGQIANSTAQGANYTGLQLTVDTPAQAASATTGATANTGTSLNLSQFAATQATLTGTQVAPNDTTSNPDIAALTTAQSDELGVSLDGGTTQYISLHGCTTLDSVVTAVQTAITGDPTDLGHLSVSDNGGTLTLTNNNAAGAGHSLTITNNNASQALGFSTLTSTSSAYQGVKVTVDGVAQVNVDVSGCQSMAAIATAIGNAVHGATGGSGYTAASVAQGSNTTGTLTIGGMTTGTTGKVDIVANAATAFLGLTTNATTANNTTGVAAGNTTVNVDLSGQTTQTGIAQTINNAVKAVNPSSANVAAFNANGTLTITGNAASSSGTVDIANNALSNYLGFTTGSAASDNSGKSAQLLTLNVDGQGAKTVDVSAATTLGQIASDINTAVGSNVASAATGSLVITGQTKGSAGSVDITDNAVSRALKLTTSGEVDQTGTNATDLKLNVDGIGEVDVDVSGVTDLTNATTGLAAVINSAVAAAGGTYATYGNIASATTDTNGNGTLTLTSKATGSTASSIQVIGNAVSTALGLTAGTTTGQDSTKLDLNVDGLGTVAVDLSKISGTGGAGHGTVTQIATYINAALAKAGGGYNGTYDSVATANSGAGSTGYLSLAGVTLGGSLSVTNNAMSKALGLAAGTSDTNVSGAAQTLNLTIDGHNQVKIDLSGLGTASVSNIAGAINTALSNDTADGYGSAYAHVATANSNGTITLAGVSQGGTLTVGNSTLSNLLGLTANTSNASNTGTAPQTLNISIDGKATENISFANVAGGSTPTLSGIAQAINTALANDTANYGSAYANAAAANANGTITISGEALGAAAGKVTIANNTASQVLGLTSGSNPSVTVTGNDESLAEVVSFLNSTAQKALGTSTAANIVSLNSSGDVVISSQTKGANSSVSVVGAGTTGNLAAALQLSGYVDSATTGQARSLASVVNSLKQSFNSNATLEEAGLTAQVNQATNSLEIKSTNGTQFRVDAWGTKTTTTDSDLGFGDTGTAFTNALTPAQSTSSMVDVQGAAAIGTAANGPTGNTASISFQNMEFGNDTQSISISANSSAGVPQTPLTITLENNNTAQTGATIDAAISAINTQLQQSDNPTLRSITAVEQTNANGTESINFISSLSSFNVAVSSSAGAAVGDGLNGGVAKTFSSTLNGSASGIAIDSQAGAEAAVQAVGAAVTKLGSAQAAVGKGENQLGYAINLASSQVTNFSAAESQIRDADVAAEAANLTKAQVLQQASLAAMAQANSAPQAVLALLRG